jgi:hypothetical protein
MGWLSVNLPTGQLAKKKNLGFGAENNDLLASIELHSRRRIPFFIYDNRAYCKSLSKYNSFGNKFTEYSRYHSSGCNGRLRRVFHIEQVDFPWYSSRRIISPNILRGQLIMILVRQAIFGPREYLAWRRSFIVKKCKRNRFWDSKIQVLVILLPRPYSAKLFTEIIDKV